MNSETLQAASILGIGLFFLGVVLDNLGTVCVKPFVKKYDWHSVMLWRFIYAIAPVLALALIVEPVPPISLEPEAVFAVLYGVLAVVLVAFSLFYFGIKHLKGVQLSALFYIDPVVGVFASSAILGEQPGTYFWVGAALVTAGVTAAEVHVKKHHRSHSFKHLHYHLKLHI